MYSVLNSLIKKGFVVSVDSGPSRYYPHPPAEVFSQLSVHYRKILGDLARKLQKIYREQQEDVFVWNLHGRRAIINKAKRMLSEAQQSVILALWHKEWRPLVNSLKHLHEKGLKVVILAYGALKTDFGEIYLHHASDPSYREGGIRKFILIVDRQELLFATFPKALGLWSRDVDAVKFFRDFVIHEIYLMKIKNCLSSEIERLFGKNWEKIRLTI
ncbi:MAG: hypothetical protein DRG83_11575 [Deltaproteobacteria bacterium]|nr:MAG: hypothetical protein DRG83_11575 [Deltaproteobacteria bacterium]